MQVLFFVIPGQHRFFTFSAKIYIKICTFVIFFKYYGIDVKARLYSDGQLCPAAQGALYCRR